MSITVNYGTEIHNLEEYEDDEGDICTYNTLELNVSNGNFNHIMATLGLNVTAWGEKPLIPVTLRQAIDDYIPGLGVRSTVVDGNIVHCGVDEEYMSNRLGTLRAIAQAYIDAGKGDEYIPFG